MKLDFNYPITNLSNEPFLDDKGKKILAKDQLANGLAQLKSIKIKPVRAVELALEISKTGVIDLQASESKDLEEFINEQSDKFTPLVIYALTQPFLKKA